MLAIKCSDKVQYLMDVQHGVWNRPYRRGWFWRDSPVQDPVSWNSRGLGVTLSSAGLYDLDTKRLLDVIGLRAGGCSSEVHVHTGQSLYSTSNSG